jgi:hypothetical protein
LAIRICEEMKLNQPLVNTPVRQLPSNPAPNRVETFFQKMIAPFSSAAEQKLGRAYGQWGDTLTDSVESHKMHAKAAQSLLRVANKIPAPENLVEAAQALEKVGFNLRIRLKERGTSFELALDYVIPIASEARVAFTEQGHLLERLHQPERAQIAFRQADEMRALPHQMVYSIIDAPGVEPGGPDLSKVLARVMP